MDESKVEVSVPVQVVGFDHLVLRVADVERSLAWYTGRLGLAEVRVEEWRRGEAPFPSVRIDDGSIIDLVPIPAGEEPPVAAVRNVDHVCLVVAATDLEALAVSGAFDVVAGPARLFGARGIGVGIYVRDPDGNVVELRHYG